MNNLASEFFYSGIAHIPPGLLIIVLYWRTETENVFHTHRDFFSSPLLFIACVLAIAWLVGLMVEAIIFVPIAYPLKLLSPHCKFASRLCLRLRLLDDERTPDKRLPPKEQEAAVESENAILEREKRRQGYFKGAITIMCRDLGVIFLFAWLASLFAWYHKLAWFQTPEPFLNLHWNGYYSFAGFFAFILMWSMQKDFLIKKEKPTEESTHQPVKSVPPEKQAV